MSASAGGVDRFGSWAATAVFAAHGVGLAGRAGGRCGAQRFRAAGAAGTRDFGLDTPRAPRKFERSFADVNRACAFAGSNAAPKRAVLAFAGGESRGMLEADCRRALRPVTSELRAPDTRQIIEPLCLTTRLSNERLPL